MHQPHVLVFMNSSEGQVAMQSVNNLSVGAHFQVNILKEWMLFHTALKTDL